MQVGRRSRLQQVRLNGSIVLLLRLRPVALAEELLLLLLLLNGLPAGVETGRSNVLVLIVRVITIAVIVMIMTASQKKAVHASA